MAIVHNLLLLLLGLHQRQGVKNTAAIQRKQMRLEPQEEELENNRQTPPLIYKTLQRFTRASFKLIRWLRAHWHQPTSLRQVLLHLTLLDAQL